jgi:tetratricopeptide (TPR) repeat protein
MLGKTGKYEEAAKQVGYAITNFSKQGNRNGVAVSYYDMASIMFEQKKYVPAIGALQFAKQHWQADSNAERLVGINNFMLRIYLAAGDLQNATEAYNANLQYIDGANIHWKDKLNFYEYGSTYFKKNAQPKEAAELDASYKVLKDSLVQKGIKVD